MSKIAVTKEKIVAVADAVREKTGTATDYSLDAMPDAILAIETGGGGGADFEINDASYLFYGGARLDCKDVFMNALADKLIGVKAMFHDCRNIEEIDLSRFDTSEITDMSYIFYQCQALKTLNISKLSTKNATNLSSMFTGCYSLESIDLSNFNTAKVTNFEQFVMNCTSLKSIDFSNIDTSKATTFSSMFTGCSNLESITGFSAINRAGTSIAFPNGNNVSSRYALKRLTFRTDLPSGTYSIRSAINIKYCSFNRDGMVEMFNTLPDVSGLTHSANYKKITITGNPCLTDGTLTDEDRAIATNKGWTLVE